MQMTNEYVMYLPQANPEFSQLHLRTFPAINQKKPLIRIEQMSGRESLGCGKSRTAAKYCNTERHWLRIALRP